jgi:hypothetical protein
MGSLVIAYHPPGQPPQSVVTVNDPCLLQAAARAAIKEAEQKAAELTAEDPVLGRLQAAEVARLRMALEILVPGFDSRPASGVM